MQPAEEVAPRQTLDRGDRRLLLAALLIVALSALYVRYNYRAAFPQASLDLRLSREEITERAQAFLTSRGLSTDGFRNLTLFDPADEPRLFLEREAGLDRANQLMSGDVAVWRWRARWYKPPDIEEMRVWLAPDGRLAGFEHIVAENAPGGAPDRDRALALAAEFLRSQTGLPHRLVEEDRQQRPKRVDHEFTWEREGFAVSGATYRRTVVMQGERVGSYTEFLHVPEQWKRDFAALRSKNSLYTQIAWAFYLPLIASAILVHIQAIQKRQVPWRPLILLCAVVGALMVANQWNSIPFFLDGMPTSTPVYQGVLIALLQGLGAGVGVFFQGMLAAAPGESLYRRAYPKLLSLPAALSRRGIETREFFRASVVGYAFAALHIAFVVAFYLVGRRFGVWSPQDVQYSDLLSTALPWLFPLTISMLASTSEEFWFRLFAIPGLEKLVRYRWAAVVIPAFVWGFLHANYPQQPGYIRGVEVGLIGVAAGFLMLRFGILSTLIWHYTVDAVLIGTFLLTAPSLYFRLSGLLVAGVVLFPLGVSIYRYRRNGGFLAAEGMTNAAMLPAAGAAVEPPEPAEEKLAAPEPLLPRRYLYIAAAIALVAGAAIAPVRYGEFIRVRIDRTEAVEIARRELGARVADWDFVAEFRPNLDAANFEYFRRRAGAGEAQRIVAERTMYGFWSVDFFRPQQKEEWIVYIDRDGRVFRTDHVVDEKAPGATVGRGEAQGIAERDVAAKGVKLEGYTLADSSEQKRERRTDHFFVWKDRRFEAGGAESRVSITVAGDEPSEFRRFLKLPDEWLREYRRLRIGRFLMPALAGSVFLTALVVFIRRLASHRFRWRRYLALGGAGAAAAALAQLNRLPTIHANYDTAVPMGDHLGDVIAGMFAFTLVAGFGAFLAALAIDVFLRLALEGRAVPRPPAAVTLCIAAALFGFQNVVGGIADWLPGDRYRLPLWSLPGASTYAPSFAVIASALMSALLWSVAAAVLIPLAMRLLSPRSLAIWVGVTAVALALSEGGGAALIAHSLVSTLAMVGLVIFLVLTCSAALPSLACAIFVLEALQGGAALASQPSAFYRWHGAAAIGAALLIAAAWQWRFRDNK